MSHSIENILKQVEKTTIVRSGFEGHLISKRQLQAIRSYLTAVDLANPEPSASSSPTTPEAFDLQSLRTELEFEKVVLQSDIEELVQRLNISASKDKPRLNHEIGKLRKELASIERRLRQ